MKENHEYLWDDVNDDDDDNDGDDDDVDDDDDDDDDDDNNDENDDDDDDGDGKMRLKAAWNKKDQSKRKEDISKKWEKHSTKCEGVHFAAAEAKRRWDGAKLADNCLLFSLFSEFLLTSIFYNLFFSHFSPYSFTFSISVFFKLIRNITVFFFSVTS